jgi:hypothetical protein
MKKIVLLVVLFLCIGNLEAIVTKQSLEKDLQKAIEDQKKIEVIYAKNAGKMEYIKKQIQDIEKEEKSTKNNEKKK